MTSTPRGRAFLATSYYTNVGVRRSDRPGVCLKVQSQPRMGKYCVCFVALLCVLWYSYSILREQYKTGTTLRLQFTKMQGAGNDFIVIEAGARDVDWSRLAVAMCDRHYGVGADGMLLVSPSEVADLRMRIFNADGSEAGTCGNGTRCIVKYYVETNRLESPERKISVETLGGIRDAWFFRTGVRAGQVRIGMGNPRSALVSETPATNVNNELDITFSRVVSVVGMDLELHLVSFGNPHGVYFTDRSPGAFPLARVGEVLDRDLFPGGLNFEVARVINRGRIEARVWEHGVGETLACGSGACAIAVSAHLRGAIDNEIEVSLPGGSLSVEWDGKSEVLLTGPAEAVFQGVWETGTASKSQEPIKNEVLA